MTVHLLKMCVGIDSIDHLRRRQAERLEAQRAAGQAAKLCHWTRNMPRRAAEIEGEGSIYWIIRGRRASSRLISGWTGRPPVFRFNSPDTASMLSRISSAARRRGEK